MEHDLFTERRRLLRQGLVSGGLIALGATQGACALAFPALPANPRQPGGLGPIGPAGGFGDLQPPDANGIRLPVGFSSRVIARSGDKVAGTSHTWHRYPDGGSVFATASGWIYVSNSEVSSGGGGVSAIAFDAAGNIRSAYPICHDTSQNCSGGPTPWNTWLTCEETSRGRVYECDPTGAKAQVVRDPLGWFEHEAVAVDRNTGYLYLTEDDPDGRLYRFRPQRAGDLSSGTLEVAQRINTAPGIDWLQWLPVPHPNPRSFQQPTRKQVRQSSPFNGGEGIWYHAGIVYFTTKGDNRVWALETANDRLAVVYDDDTSPTPVLKGVDAVTASAVGDLYVAEDGGDMQLVMISPNGSVAPVLQVVGQDGSEITGPAFSPDGRRLYFSSQRGGSGGITYEMTGPFVPA